MENDKNIKSSPPPPRDEDQNLRPKNKDFLKHLIKISPVCYKVNIGFVPNMKVPGYFYVNPALENMVFAELEEYHAAKGGGGFLPAVKQLANVASLPGVVGGSIGLPDIHSGYGFAIGNVAAMNMSSDLPPELQGVVSPGGVGFDINCGVRLLRTNLLESDILHVKEELAQALYNLIPVGVGCKSSIPMDLKSLDRALKEGVQWCIDNGFGWPEDRLHCEELGCMSQADPSVVSQRAKQRGLSQIGTLGAGNHYAEVQVVEEIFNQEAADVMGIGRVGQVCIMIHSGSRGFGHQVATDALQTMEKLMARDNIQLNDRQLACATIHSKEGQDYLKGMACAANYAWINRQSMTHLTRKAFASVLSKTPQELDMHVVYDVSHNIAKIETHYIPHSDSDEKLEVLVHRKGSTRAFGPGSLMIPEAYRKIGQPVLVGGTMGTCSYVLTGTEKGMRETFGSTCHGAGRALSRNKARTTLDSEQVLAALKAKNISIRVASPKLITEEGPESYKDVVEVVETCHEAGISLKCVKLKPVAVIKG